MQNLSGGELQRVAIVLCLGKPADVYLIDEPSAYLDSEQRIACSKVTTTAGRDGLGRGGGRLEERAWPWLCWSAAGQTKPQPQ